MYLIRMCKVSILALSIFCQAYVFAGGPKHTYDSFLIARGTHMLFKRIEPGTFIMGSKDEERRQKDGPQHEVTISKAFDIGVFEVTQQQWNKVMGKWTWSNPARFGGRLSNPVENVSWNEVNEFIAALNSFDSSAVYRLPTEAEWEYACRAGTTTRTYWGDDPEHKEALWHAWRAGGAHGSTHPVGQLNPNPWGLYDMNGNVAEFAQDMFAPYKPGSQVDPLNTEGESVVFRGGDWFHGGDCDSEGRRKSGKDGGLSFLGFRVVREVD